MQNLHTSRGSARELVCDLSRSVRRGIIHHEDAVAVREDGRDDHREVLPLVIGGDDDQYVHRSVTDALELPGSSFAIIVDGPPLPRSRHGAVEWPGAGRPASMLL